DVDEDGLARDAERLQQLRRGFGLDLGRRERIDDDDGAVLQLLGERRAERAAADFFRQRVLVAARLRTEDGAAVPPERVADRADARASRALLPPRLLAAPLHVRAVLRLVRAAPLRRVGLDDRLPHQVAVHASAEHVVADVDAADFRVLVVDDVDFHFLPFFGFSTCATLIRFAATALRMTT